MIEPKKFNPNKDERYGLDRGGRRTLYNFRCNRNRLYAGSKSTEGVTSHVTSQGSTMISRPSGLEVMVVIIGGLLSLFLS